MIYLFNECNTSNSIYRVRNRREDGTGFKTNMMVSGVALPFCRGISEPTDGSPFFVIEVITADTAT